MKYEYTSDCFSDNLKKLMELNKLRQCDLVKFLKKSKGAISNYVSGDIPNRDNLLELADFFDVDVKSFFVKNDDENTALHETDNPSYKIPVFHKTLIPDAVIYKTPNYVGIISSPLPIDAEGDCYAVKMYDDSMKSFGFFFGSLVFFSPEDKVESGDIVAVLIKSKKQIFIRSVKLDKRKITLISDEKTEEFKVTRNDCDVQILGKVVHATFNPNKKSTD